MAQNGLHGLVGLAVARPLLPRIPFSLRATLAGALVLGAMLPDVDVYPTAVVFLAGRKDLVYAIHRTLTHSVWLILAVAALGWMFRPRRTAAAWACWGLALGMATHAFLDSFCWFAPLDLFWPLSHLPAGAPLLPHVDLWAHVRLPALFGNTDAIPNLLQAFELGAFALYLTFLRRYVRRDSVWSRKLRALDAWIPWMWGLFALAAVAVPFLSKTQEEILVTTPYLLALLPFCWSQTLRLRGAIAGVPAIHASEREAACVSRS